MLRNNVLSDKLNSYKTGTITKEDESKNVEEVKYEQKTSGEENFLTIVGILQYVVKAAIFGYALNIVLQTSWPFIPTMVVGFAIEFFSNKILLIFKK